MKTFETENYRYGSKVKDLFAGDLTPKVEYIIDPDKGGYSHGKAYKGVIVCKITPNDFEPLANAWNREVKHSFKGIAAIANILSKEFNNEKKFPKAFGPYIGVAYCSVEDTFDVKVGKRLARERAMTKLFKFQTSYLGTLIDEVTEIENDLFSMMQECKFHLEDFMGIEDEGENEDEDERDPQYFDF